jgi:hypothetical protein
MNLAVSARGPDEFIAVAGSATKYLQHVRFQVALCDSTALHDALGLLSLSYTRYEENLSEADILGERENRQFYIWRENMSRVLSDISALPKFAVAHSINSTIPLLLQKWLSSARPQLQVCACIMLGNLSLSNEVCEEFVHIGIHNLLMSILATASHSRLLYYALGCLRNLAHPARNKITLGGAGLLGPLSNLWSANTLPQIQSSAISLTRQLLISNLPNVLRISAPLSIDPDSPASNKSQLSALISIFIRTDIDPVRIEIARALATVCQVLAPCDTSSDNSVIQMRRRDIFEHNRDICVPLGFMLSQKKRPIVRSEGWFVLALLAHTEEGVQCVADIMHNVDVFMLLMELVTGRTFIERMTSPTLCHRDAAGAQRQQSDGRAKEEEKVRVDRENAIALVRELLRRRGSTMALIRRTEFENLLHNEDGMSRLCQPVVVDSEAI